MNVLLHLIKLLVFEKEELQDIKGKHDFVPKILCSGVFFDKKEILNISSQLSSVN